jgi:hypothetical protein
MCTVANEPPFQFEADERLAWSVYKETISLSAFDVVSIPNAQGTVTLFLYSIDRLEWVLGKRDLSMTREEATLLIDMITTIYSTIRTLTIAKNS